MSDALNLQQAAWHLVQTRPRQEFRALEHLKNQGYGCFLPTLQIEKIRRGKRDICIEPLFSRYLFIRLNAVTSNWSPLRSTRGVSKLVAFGGRFATLPDMCVEALKNALPQHAQQHWFEPGERVVITSGPFAGCEGIYQAPDGAARALILIELMRQPQKLLFAVERLRKLA